MQIDLTAEDAQVLQNALNRSIHQLKVKKHDLGVERQTGVIGQKKHTTGVAKLNAKIDHLRELSSILEPVKLSGDTGEGYEDQFRNDGPIIEVTHTIVTTPGQVAESVEIVVWEGEGGLCRD